MQRTYRRLLSQLWGISSASLLAGACSTPAGVIESDRLTVASPPPIDASAYPRQNGPCVEELICARFTGDCPVGAAVDPLEDLGIDACHCSLVDGPYDARGEPGCCYVASTRACDTGLVE